MITTLLFDFWNVLAFSGGVGEERVVLNQKLITWVAKQQKPAHILTNTPPEFIQQLQAELVPPFQNIISARELGLSKTDPSIYSTVAEKLSVKPEEILFCDDQQHNVAAAQSAGLQTILFESTDQFLRKVPQMLI